MLPFIFFVRLLHEDVFYFLVSVKFFPSYFIFLISFLHPSAISQQSDNEFTLRIPSTAAATVPGNPGESAALATGADQEVRNADNTFDSSANPGNCTVASNKTQF